MKKCEWSLAIHGGAGILKKDQFSDELLNEYEQVLRQAIIKGSEVLIRGGSSTEAVCASVVIMEDSPLFNAGKGSVVGHTGVIEMDASIMEGKKTKVGGVSCVRKVKNPILLAREVMERSPHSLLVSDGAELYAYQRGIKLEDPKYFYTERRWLQLEAARKKDQVMIDHEGQTQTVGAVAMDKNGDLAAATSTGGMTNKAFGRASDTSIIGAGNFADNKTCAISGTGTGDQFIQNVTCFDFHALILYQNKTLKEAGEIVLQKLKDVDGYGGFVAVDPFGKIEMGFNSGGMFRAKMGSDQDIHIRIF